MAYAGELLALLTAFVWAVAVIFFKRSGQTVHPVALNLLKNVVAVLLFIPTCWLMGEALLYDASLRDYGFMLLGGIIGIALSDTLFFVSLNLVGASLVAIVDCLYAPSIIFLSFVFLGETLSWVQILGATLIVAAVLTPVFEQRGGIDDRRRVVKGTLLGALAMLTMAGSLVMVKPILDHSPVVWSSMLRMLGGTIGLVVYLAFKPGRMRILRTLRGEGLKYGLLGSVIGSYLAMMLWLGGMKYTKVSIASALNQTTNVFLFILAAVVLKEMVTKQRIAGIALGVGGALLVTFG
jgi:drug/metabolite transporter (DMT)-like permease